MQQQTYKIWTLGIEMFAQYGEHYFYQGALGANYIYKSRPQAAGKGLCHTEKVPKMINHAVFLMFLKVMQYFFNVSQGIKKCEINQKYMKCNYKAFMNRKHHWLSFKNLLSVGLPGISYLVQYNCYYIKHAVNQLHLKLTYFKINGAQSSWND